MRYLNLLKRMELEEKRKKKRKNKFTFKLLLNPGNLVLISTGILFIISLILLIIFKSAFFAFISLILDYVLVILFSYQYIYPDIRRLKKWLALPFNRTINLNVKAHYYLDKKYINALHSLDIQQLKIGCNELKSESEFFEQRIRLIIGPLDKLGILPGIISTFSLLSDNIFNNVWLKSLPYAYIVLMFMSIIGYKTIVRYKRMILLTELVIETKSDNKI